MEEEIIVGGAGSHQVVLKSGPRKPRLENVSLAQWTVANLAILYKLHGESKLSGDAILDYLSYKTKIYQLVQRYNLVSVLFYDREYRKLQCARDFCWGTDVPHLHSVYLQPQIPCPNNLTQRGSNLQAYKSQPTSSPQTLDGKVICKLYNTKGVIMGNHASSYTSVHNLDVIACTQRLPIINQKLGKASADIHDGLRLSAWEEQFKDDFDHDFLLHGIKNGFDFTDKDATPLPIECTNHKSAQPGSPLFEQATTQVLKEIQIGHYEIVSEPPRIASPMGVVPKPDRGVRMTHDCSLPKGQSVNDYCISNWHQRFS